MVEVVATEGVSKARILNGNMTPKARDAGECDEITLAYASDIIEGDGQDVLIEGLDVGVNDAVPF